MTFPHSFRETPEGQLQAEALRTLESASGRRRSEIVAELPVEHDQYRRYLRGDTPLRWDHVPLFARAYRVPTSTLTRALGLLADDFDARAYLRGRLQESDIDAFLLEHGDAKPEAQRAAADGLLEVAAEQRRGDPLPAPMVAPRRDQPAS